MISSKAIATLAFFGFVAGGGIVIYANQDFKEVVIVEAPVQPAPSLIDTHQNTTITLAEMPFSDLLGGGLMFPFVLAAVMILIGMILRKSL